MIDGESFDVTPGLGEATSGAATRRLPKPFVLVTSAAAIAALLLSLLAAGTGYAYAPARVFETAHQGPSVTDPNEARKLAASLVRQNKQTAAAIRKIEPQGNYIVIDQTQNRLYLMNGGRVVHESICSAGSGMVLRDSAGQRKWVFDTPRGVFKVRNRVEDPAWRKPDWAFVEEGRPIPKNPAERIEYGTLGEYALYLEDGYMIHGTLYERMLGRSVSHGCIRLGRDDLRVMWRGAPIGTPVYIF